MLRNARYFSNIILLLSLVFQLLATLVFAHSAMRSLMCRVDNGLEMKLCVLSNCRAARNDLAPELDISAMLATICLPVNVVPPFLDSKLFWQPSCTHLYPRMTCLVAAADGRDVSTYQDIVLSPVLCQKLHHRAVTTGTQIVAHNCLPDFPPRSKKIE